MGEKLILKYWKTTPQKDGSHHSENADFVCERAGLDDTFKPVLIEIMQQWEKDLGSAAYLQHLLTWNLVKMCKEPEDLKRISEIVLPYFKDIFYKGDGSIQFIGAVLRHVNSAGIAGPEDLEFVCKSVYEQNEAFRNSEKGKKIGSRSGEQYPEYVIASIRELLHQKGQ